MSAALTVARSAMRTLQAVSPRAAGALADRLFCTPPAWRPSPAHRAFLRTGEPFSVESDGRRVAAWRWGRGSGPVVIMVHGWGSRGMRFRGLAQELAATGHTAIVFDAPGHGDSAGRTSSMVQFARALLAIAESVGPVRAVVGHSLGGSASALAMRLGLAVECAVFIGAPRDPGRYVHAFASTVGVSPAALAAMRERIARRLRMSWDRLDVASMGREVDVPLLVVHDRGDAEVPWSEGAAIAAAWRGAELFSTEGLGHHALVNHPDVVRRVIGHVDGRAS